VQELDEVEPRRQVPLLEAHQSLPNADTTMYNDELQPKPACDAVVDTLRGYVISRANSP
jgi:hypothetical protein